MGFPRLLVTDRAGRWLTRQIGENGRSVQEIANELGCDWHTVNDTLLAYGEALVDDDPTRFGLVEALGLDEVLFVSSCARASTGASVSPPRSLTSSADNSSTSCLVEVGPRPAPGSRPKGRSGSPTCATRPWTSRAYRSVFDKTVPRATQVADPFHVIKLANLKLDECRRRVQNELFGHRGRKHDSLYRARLLLTKADERLSDNGREKLMGLLNAGDPKGEVFATWRAKELVRGLYDHHDPDLALEFVQRLGNDLQESELPEEARSLGRTLLRWKDQIAAWHEAHVSNGPTEAAILWSAQNRVHDVAYR